MFVNISIKNNFKQINLFSQEPTESTEKEVKTETVRTNNSSTSSTTAAMDTQADDVAKESCSVTMETGRVDVAKESCAVTTETGHVDVAKESCAVTMETGRIDVAKESCAVTTETGHVDVAKGHCAVTVETGHVDVAKDPSVGATEMDVTKIPCMFSTETGDHGVAKEPCTVAMDTQPANAAKVRCTVTMETGPGDVAMEPCSVVRTDVPCAVTSPGHVTMDSAHSPGLAGSSPQGSGREGCLDSSTGCGKDSQEENSGLGGGRLEGGQGVLDEACPDHKDELTSRLDDSGIDNTATDLACHGNDTSVCHQVDTDSDKTVIDTARRCHTECSAGVTSCLEASSRHCDTSNCVTGTSCDNATPTTGAEGSTDSPGCDSVNVTQKDDTSSVCQRDPVPASTHCCLDTNTAAAVVSSEAKVTDGCKEACTKTMNCIDADTCTKTKDSEQVTDATSALEVNVGRGPPSVDSLEHVMSPCSSSTLTAPNMSPFVETDSQEEFTDPPVTLTHDKVTKTEQDILPRDLNGVREKLLKNGYTSIVSIHRARTGPLLVRTLVEIRAD